MEETWKPIKNYEQYYSVSNIGRIRREAPGPGTYIGRILRLRKNMNGYMQTYLCKNNKVQTIVVHSLVAEHFISKRPKNFQINHKDGNKTNNYFSNLEYVSASENIKHYHRILNQLNNRAKLTVQEVLDIIEQYKTGKFFQKDLAKTYGISRSAISAIVCGKNWRRFYD